MSAEIILAVTSIVILVLWFAHRLAPSKKPAWKDNPQKQENIIEGLPFVDTSPPEDPPK